MQHTHTLWFFSFHNLINFQLRGLYSMIFLLNDPKRAFKKNTEFPPKIIVELFLFIFRNILNKYRVGVAWTFWKIYADSRSVCSQKICMKN